uniref:Uncharacterized protein n=1 Tax=Myoviridae sp. ctfrL10 TaxID=2826678 RepID=A0A8S5MS10_9CAUD|nr:MAG TPA: hypothetical protein [Myoviridae sp. ctfrL10]
MWHYKGTQNSLRFGRCRIKGIDVVRWRRQRGCML